MTETSIIGQIRKLVALQQIDQKIYDSRRGLREKPAQIEELNKQFGTKKQRLQDIEAKYKKSLVDRKSKEVEMKAKEDAIAKANAQLSQIKTNKEYTAKITEIENIKADKSIIEEQILISYDESDVLKLEMDKEKILLADEERAFFAQKSALESEIKKEQESILALEAERDQIAPEIDKCILKRYDQILENKDGLAIVPVEGQSCGGCFMNVPAQVINEIKMHDNFISCEMCNRILYLKEDVE